MNKKIVLQDIQRKARFGHRDWIYWTDKTGTGHAEKKTVESVKRCLLACGTSGRWLLVTANDGTLMLGCWWIGINLMAHMKRGWF